MKEKTLTFHILYKRYAKDVYRFSYWLCGDESEAKDITSETFVRVWTAQKEMRAESVKAYLFTIARNLFLKGQRRNNKFASLDSEMVDESTQIQKDLEVNQQLTQVFRALQKLPDIDRTIMIMMAEKEMSYAEIAQVTGISIAAIKVKIYRARIKINKLLQEGENL